ncbi:MAG: calcium-binding protein [Dehalococcoidia bacterium]|nr:calcium-binding protein [Dehalococcoidia bacterium]
MPELPVDNDRERHITYEIIVDAYGPEEQAMGWIITLKRSFSSRCEGGALRNVLMT